MPRFTVMIPTRERCDTLRHALASCVAQPAADFEIIVSDNCSEDQTEAVTRSFDDPRVRYLRTPRRLSMTGNFEFALGQSTGEYVMFLGDDDGLLPDALERVAGVIASTGAEAVTSSQAMYYWPNALDERTRNRLLFSLRAGVEIRQSSRILDDVLQFRRAYMELPGAYAGFVSRRVIDAARVDGRYFNSVTPDSYSGIVNASLLPTYAYVCLPFALAGQSGRSNGASQMRGNATPGSASSEAARYEQENDLPYHPEMVYCPSYEVIMAEAFLQARDRLPTVARHSLDIAELCRVALRDAPDWNYAQIETAVGAIRARHGIAHASHGRKPAALARESRRRRVERGLVRLWRRYINIDAGEFQVRNVNQAAQLIQFVATYRGRGYGTLRHFVSGWLARARS